MPDRTSAVFDLAQAVLDCICSELEAVREIDETHPGCPCHACVWAGEPDHVFCCEDCDDDRGAGQLSVHVASIFPSSSFPTATTVVHPCAPQTMVAEVVVTILRCLPTMDEMGTPAHCDDMTTASMVSYADLRAAYVALTCCVPALPLPGRTKRRVSISRAGPLPLVGCAGVQLSAFVDAGALCPCPEGS